MEGNHYKQDRANFFSDVPLGKIKSTWEATIMFATARKMDINPTKIILEVDWTKSLPTKCGNKMDKNTSKATTEVVKHKAFGIRKIGDPLSLAPPGDLRDQWELPLECKSWMYFSSNSHTSQAIHVVAQECLVCSISFQVSVCHDIIWKKLISTSYNQ
jgi:hypothetical protein